MSGGERTLQGLVGGKYSGFTITFVPILKYAWGHWFPSCCLLRLLPPFFFSARSVYIKCLTRKGTEGYMAESRPRKLGFAFPQHCPWSQPHFFLLQMPCLLIDSWNWVGKPVICSLRVISPQPILWSRATLTSLLFQTHQTLFCHRASGFAVLCVSNAFLPGSITAHSTTSYRSLRESHFPIRFLPSHPNMLVSLYFHILLPYFSFLFST